MSSHKQQDTTRATSSKPIEIVKKTTIQKQMHKRDKTEIVYSLTENIFDPTKFSPPNSFIANLKKRMNFYEEITCEFYFDNN
jgi:hypothetical protein